MENYGSVQSFCSNVFWDWTQTLEIDNVQRRGKDVKFSHKILEGVDIAAKWLNRPIIFNIHMPVYSIILQQCLLRFSCLRSSSFSQINVNKNFLWFLPDSLKILAFETFEALAILDQGNLLRGIDNCCGYKSVRRPWTTVLVKKYSTQKHKRGYQ